MSRPLSLRQVEVFKAVIERGGVSRAAQALNMSQPAASKLLSLLEYEAGFKLFDRVRGRLVVTPQGNRLYEEVDRIFNGLRQLEKAVEVIRREEQGQLLIGVLPALSGIFAERVMSRFLLGHKDVCCSIFTLETPKVQESLLSRRLDVGIASGAVESPYLVCRRLMRAPLVCIMPVGHPLSRQKIIRPRCLEGQPFVAFNIESHTSQKIGRMFVDHATAPKVTVMANSTQTVTCCVAAGHGVSLVHPVYAAGMERSLETRPFLPAIEVEFVVAYDPHNPNLRRIEQFLQDVEAVAQDVAAQF
jgi:DNA-binding transcriptional LysR family regulator